MSAVTDVALPVFALILAGWIAGRTRLLGPEATAALNQFVFWFALPALLFLGMARTPTDEIFNWPFVGAFLGGMLVVYAAGWLMGMATRRESQAVHSMQALTACFSNTGYMGIPLFVAAFGAERILPATIATVIMSAVMVGVAVVALELVGSAHRGPLRALGDVGRALAKNPLVLSPIAGLLWGATGLPLPTPVVNFCQFMGAASGPCALFAIGLFLAGQKLTARAGEIGWIVALKLVVQPLITYGLILTLFPLDPFWTGAAVLLAALPTGGLTFVVATQYGVYVERTSQAILVSTVVSIPILSALLAVYAG